MNAREAFADFDPPARAALLEAVEMNRADLDRLADEYQREQIASAQSGTEDEPAEDLG